MALILFFSREQIFTKFDKLIFVLLLLLLAPGVTFHYYLLLLVILYLVSFDLEHTRSDGGEPNVKSYILNSNWSRKFFTLIMFLTIPCWAFPWNLVLPSALSVPISSHWILLQILLAAFFLINLGRGAVMVVQITQFEKYKSGKGN
jgi:phosphatidylglycerophosphate synthase